METLYIGIDLGKNAHYAAFLSKPLLKKHKKYESCPTLRVPNDREGFMKLLDTMTSHAPASNCHILMEHTGHYGAALEQFLTEQGCTLYRVQGQKRYRANKTDKSDAQSLSVLLYNQIGLRTIALNETNRVMPLIPASETARELRGLVQHRVELVEEATQRKNKLTSLLDEIFPEFVQVYKDPNAVGALAIREKYPTPQAVLQSSEEPTRLLRLEKLRTLAAKSIGTRDAIRLKSLVLQQRQLIAELRLLMHHIQILDETITAIVDQSREGQILQSIARIGPIQAATLIAGIGSIANFENAKKLRGYLGWAPRRTQTGSSLDSTSLNKSGNARLKQTIYLIAINAVQEQGYWKALYTRLVERKCVYNPKTGKYTGKMKVVGRIAGELIEMIYLLLRKDYDRLRQVPAGHTPPAPMLYDPAHHHPTSASSRLPEVSELA